MIIHNYIPDEINTGNKYIIYGKRRNVWRNPILISVLCFENDFIVEYTKPVGVPSEYAIEEIIKTGKLSDSFHKYKHIYNKNIIFTSPKYSELEVSEYLKATINRLLLSYQRRCKNSIGAGEFVIIETDNLKDIGKYIMMQELSV